MVRHLSCALILSAVGAGCTTSDDPVDAGQDLGSIDAGVADDGVIDLGVDAPIDAPALVPPDAGSPPRVPCGDDAGPWTTDPCPHWVQCLYDGAWSATYYGTCGADGACAFSAMPFLEYCTTTCVTGPYGTCSRPLSTGSLEPSTDPVCG